MEDLFKNEKSINHFEYLSKKISLDTDTIIDLMIKLHLLTGDISNTILEISKSVPDRKIVKFNLEERTLDKEINSLLESLDLFRAAIKCKSQLLESTSYAALKEMRSIISELEHDAPTYEKLNSILNESISSLEKLKKYHS
jgi:hypothetical protein